MGQEVVLEKVRGTKMSCFTMQGLGGNMYCMQFIKLPVNAVEPSGS